MSDDIKPLGGFYQQRVIDSMCAADEAQARIATLEQRLKESESYAESLAKDICTMEDALGFKEDCHDKNGAFISTLGPWLERVRDLIAAEGELGDVKERLKELEKALHFYAD